MERWRWRDEDGETEMEGKDRGRDQSIESSHRVRVSTVDSL